MFKLLDKVIISLDDTIGHIIGRSDSHLFYKVKHENGTESWYEPQELTRIDSNSNQTLINKITELSKVNTYGGKQYINTLISTDWQSGEVRYGLNWGKECKTIDFYSLESCISILKNLRSRMQP